MKIALCGSMSFAASMKAMAQYLETRGHTCFLPFGLEDYVNRPLKMSKQTREEGAEKKKRYNLIRGYAAVIKQADAVLVINYKKGNEDNYIGGNTLIEMGIAFVEGKKIYLLNPIPQNPLLRQEVVAMDPVVLRGDLDRVW